MRILVIDDEPNIRALLRRVLGAAGHEILDACNGKEGVKLFESERPDLVIVDMLMPEMDGAETILNLRSREIEAKIIAMSGGSPSLPPRTCLQVGDLTGCTLTLGKPFTRDQLLKAVSTALSDCG
jgi:CheY-like chemotaxis protein